MKKMSLDKRTKQAGDKAVSASSAVDLVTSDPVLELVVLLDKINRRAKIVDFDSYREDDQ